MVKSGSVQGKLREEIVRLIYDVAVHNTKDIDNLITRNERLKTSYKEIARVMNTEIAKIRKAGGGNLGLGPDGKISYTNVKSIAGKAGAPLLTKKTMPKAMGMEREGDLIERFGGVERFKALQSAAKYMNTELMQTPSVLGKVGVEIDKYGTPWRGQVKLTGKAFPKAMDRAIQANKRFRGELLSVMFFGMAMQRTFKGLTNGAMEMAGGTSLLAESINIFMIPAALDWNEVLIPISKSLMETDDSTKSLIGHIAILGGIIGGVLTGVMMMGLAIGGLEKFRLGRGLIALGSWLQNLAITPIQWVATLFGRIAGFVWTALVKAWTFIAGGINWTNIKTAVQSIWTGLKGIVGLNFTSLLKSFVGIGLVIGAAVIAIAKLNEMLGGQQTPAESVATMELFQQQRRGGTKVYGPGLAMPVMEIPGEPIIIEKPGEPIIIENNLTITTSPLSGLTTEQMQELARIINENGTFQLQGETFVPG